MEKQSGKRNQLLKNIIIFAALGVLVSIVAICTFEGKIVAVHHKLSYGTGVLIAIILVYTILRCLEGFLKKLPSQCVYLWTFLFFLALTYVSIKVRNEPLRDYGEVYNAAINYLNGAAVEWGYFSRWPNNYFLFWVLVFGGKISLLLGVQDIFYVLVTLNAFATALTALCVFKIIEYYEPEKKYLQYFGAALFVVFIPLWAGTQYIYSDSTSILFGVATVLCLIKNKSGNWGWLILGGITMSLGLLLKPTTCVCVIAFIAIEILFSYKKGDWKKYSVLAAVTFLILASFSVVKANAPYHQHDAEWKAPFQFWFALGLLEDGSFEKNVDFAVECLAAETYDRRVELANNVIKNEIGQLVTWNHIYRKALCNFGHGGFGCSLFQYYGGLGYDLFNPFGKHGGFFATVATMYFWLLLFFAALSAAIMLFDKKKSKPLLTWLFGFFGIVVFLMLWEASNRQLYNQIPLITLLGCFSIEYLFGKIILLLKKKKEEIHG